MEVVQDLRFGDSQSDIAESLSLLGCYGVLSGKQ
jgi:hypothetical protein